MKSKSPKPSFTTALPLWLRKFILILVLFTLFSTLAFLTHLYVPTLKLFITAFCMLVLNSFLHFTVLKLLLVLKSKTLKIYPYIFTLASILLYSYYLILIATVCPSELLIPLPNKEVSLIEYVVYASFSISTTVIGLMVIVEESYAQSKKSFHHSQKNKIIHHEFTNYYPN